ncbi:MAG: hypothetical protein Fur0022_05270 [Anaerolineales bacterium]
MSLQLALYAESHEAFCNAKKSVFWAETPETRFLPNVPWGEKAHETYPAKTPIKVKKTRVSARFCKRTPLSNRIGFIPPP